MAKKKPAPKKKSPVKAAARKAVKAKPSPKKAHKAKPAAKRPAKAPAKKKPVPAKKAAAKPGKKVAAKKPAPPKPHPKTSSSRPSGKLAPKTVAKVAPAKVAAKPAVPVPKAAPVKAAPPAKVVAKAPAPSPAKKEAPKPAAPAAKKAVKEKEPVIAVMTGVDPLSGPVRTLKRALKERFQVELYVRSTPFALYELISTPSGFSKWFCDDVNVRGEEFTFVWGNDEQTAEVLSRKQGELMRFHWKDDDDDGSFFEIRIRIDTLTNEVALVVTDHAWPNELPQARQLWESQIATLQRVLGA